MRFDDALHEFDTITGVAEDVTDIILNLKDLVLVSHSEEPVTLRLDVRGAEDVTAADIKTNPDVEVLNGDLPLANLNGKGRLAIDLTVRRAAATCRPTATRPRPPSASFPIDSIFSPVRRVTFEVEPTRVEQSTDFDRLVLDIETDGSITPREALASAGGTLRALVQLVEEMSDEPQGLELGEAGPAATGSPDLDLPIEDLELSERPRNCLKRAQVNTVGELLSRARTTCWPSPTSARSPSTRSSPSSTSAASRSRERGLTMPARPRKGQRFGGSSAHQKPMMANLVASLIAAEGIVTTEAKAKAVRPVAEKMITKAQKGGVHNHRQVVAFLGDPEMASKLFDEIGPRYEDRPGATPGS